MIDHANTLRQESLILEVSTPILRAPQPPKIITLSKVQKRRDQSLDSTGEDGLIELEQMANIDLRVNTSGGSSSPEKANKK